MHCVFLSALSASEGARMAQRAGGQSNRGFLFGRLQIWRMGRMGQPVIDGCGGWLVSARNCMRSVGGWWRLVERHLQIGLCRNGLVGERTFVL